MVGTCSCKPGYADEADTKTNPVCFKCGNNVATCVKDAKTGVITSKTCIADYYLAGNSCAKSSEAVDGYFWDTTGTTS